jgi:hypothetical protein
MQQLHSGELISREKTKRRERRERLIFKGSWRLRNPTIFFLQSGDSRKQVATVLVN